MLDLWPEGSDEVSRVTLTGAYLAAIGALNAGLQFDRAADLCDEATLRLTNVDAADRAALLVRAATYRGLNDSPEVGLALIEQALGIYSDLPPNTGYVQALDRQAMLLDQLGRFDDGYRVTKSAVEVVSQLARSVVASTNAGDAGLARGGGR